MIAQWALEDCGSCVKAQRDIAAVQMEQELGLPALSGSDKQVSYARSIREEARQMLGAYMDKHSTATDMAASEALLYGISDSGWWIDFYKSGSFYAEALIAWVRPIVTIALGYKAA
jgi:hypothetical protein